MKNIPIAAILILSALPAAAQNAMEGRWTVSADLSAVQATLAADKAAAGTGADAVAAQAAPGITSTQQLLDMRRDALEALYKTLPPGPIPDGESDGIASREPGTVFGRISETVLGAFWHGKVFDRANGQLINRLITGEMVKAKVFYGESWLDGKPAIIIDYKDTSTIAGFIRDEIREVAPGIYFGFAYERRKDGPARANIVFALNFNTPKKDASPAQ